MASVATVNLEIHRGDDERLQAFITPYSAASALHFMAKKRFGDADADAEITKSLGSGITIVAAGSVGVPAEAMIAINKADSQAAATNKETKLFYELTDGANHTLVKGVLTITPEVRLAG